MPTTTDPLPTPIVRRKPRLSKPYYERHTTSKYKDGYEAKWEAVQPFITKLPPNWELGLYFESKIRKGNLSNYTYGRVDLTYAVPGEATKKVYSVTRTLGYAVSIRRQQIGRPMVSITPEAGHPPIKAHILRSMTNAELAALPQVCFDALSAIATLTTLPPKSASRAKHPPKSKRLAA